MRNHNRSHFGASLLLLALAAATFLPVQAADWPQWRGLKRDGISPETNLSFQWPASGPRKVWEAKVGEGFASVAVAGGRAYTVGNTKEKDTVFCFDANNGKVLWKHTYPSAGSPQGYDGSRATPTVEGKRVYTLGLWGQAFCLDAQTGKVIWGVDLRRAAGAEPPKWGFAGSPLIHGNLVIYNAGPAGAALDKNSGKVVWQSGKGTAGYASPVPYSANGKQGLAIFAGTGLVGVDATTGKRLWDFPWKTSYDVNAADPIFVGDTVFVSSNYDTGCALLRLSGSHPQEVWKSKAMRNHANTCVLLGGELYGNDQNTLKCIDFKTGAERWQHRGIGKGGLMAAGGNLLVLTERGELLVVKAQAGSYQELAHAQVLNGTGWTSPTLANGKLYCRNEDGSLVCLNVARTG